MAAIAHLWFVLHNRDLIFSPVLHDFGRNLAHMGLADFDGTSVFLGHEQSIECQGGSGLLLQKLGHQHLALAHFILLSACLNDGKHIFRGFPSSRSQGGLACVNDKCRNISDP